MPFVVSPVGFDQDVLPAVQLQTAAADHHIQAEQGEGLRGGRSAAGVQEGKRPRLVSRLLARPEMIHASAPSRPPLRFAGGRSVR